MIKFGSERSKLLVNKVFQILNIKAKDYNIDVSNLEKEIDQLVYQLYGLTDEEIKIVEGELG